MGGLVSRKLSWIVSLGRFCDVLLRAAQKQISIPFLFLKRYIVVQRRGLAGWGFGGGFGFRLRRDTGSTAAT